MSYGEDDWFQYTNEFNRPADSPGAVGNYNYEPGNIDNIPLNDDAPLSPSQGLDFDLTVPLDEYQYDPLRLSPNGGINRQHQQPGTSTSNDVGGQFQSMHVMQNNDTFDQHMQQSTSMEYNSFEMPTVVNSTHDAGPFQDLGIDDPNSYYASQQPSTSQGNDVIMNENYEMMGQPSTSYMPQMDHMNTSSIGNPSSHSGMNQQDMGGAHTQQQTVKPKPPPRKRPAPKKKTPAAAPDTVGTVLTKVNKMTQQIESSNDNQAKIEARITAEDSIKVGQLMMQMTQLQTDMSRGIDRSEEIANLQAQIAQVFTKNMAPSADDESENIILNQIQEMTCVAGPSTSSQQAQPPKKPVKRNRNNQNARGATQQQLQQPPPQQTEIAPARIVMDPPTTTLVPTTGQYNTNTNDGYMNYHSIDEQGTSQQQQYNEYHQPASHESMTHLQNQGQPQIVQARVVPSMNQRTHNYRQAVIFPTQNTNGPGPSPQLQQPHSHENHQVDQMHDQQYHPQDHQVNQSEQMYISVHHQQENAIYQPQEMEPTLGDVVRQTQGRYQGPQDAPNLRQQLITNVNATTTSVRQVQQRSLAPTPSPGNFHNNGQQQYGEPIQHHSSFPRSHDMQPHSHSQSQPSYDNQYDGIDEFFEMPMQNQDTQMVQMHSDSQYDQQEMYETLEEPTEPEVEYPPVPPVSTEMTEEELAVRLEDKKIARAGRVKEILREQLKLLEAPVDMSAFRSKKDLLERMLPYHHFSHGEEPISNFNSKFQKTMEVAFRHANALGNRIRNIVLRDTMRTSTEWEENMILFLETESERRKLEEDRQLADQDPHAFLQSSDIIQNVRNNKLNLEQTRSLLTSMPEHMKDLDLQNGQLSAIYREYEFDSYDENRPRGSPIPFVYEEAESESEPEPEFDMEKENGDEVNGDISPLVGFPQLSPIPSPTRIRNESESTFDWKDDDDSPLLSPEVERPNPAAEQFRREIFGTPEELDKPEPFPFEQISEVARKHQEQMRPQKAVESVSSTLSSRGTSENSPQAHSNRSSPVQIEQPPRSPSPISCKPSSSTSSIDVSVTVSKFSTNRDEESPEIDEYYSMSPRVPPMHSSASIQSVPTSQVEETTQVQLPIPIHMIKEEKEDSIPKLKLRVPVSVFQKGIEMAVGGEDDISELKESELDKRKPLKLRLNLKNVKLEEPSPDRDVSGNCPKSRAITPIPQKAVTITANTEASLITKHDEESSPMKTPVRMSATGQTKLLYSEKSSSKNSIKTPSKNAVSKSPVFKTPLHTPIKKASSESRKRRSDKIEDSPPQKKKVINRPPLSSFVTPKNGLIVGEETSKARLLRTMTEGRRIVLKINKVTRNINHLVTPRRDKNGNLHKDLTPTKETRLKIKLFKKNGILSCEVTEKDQSKNDAEGTVKKSEEVRIVNGSSSGRSKLPTPIANNIITTKGRPASASRKPSIDAPGKDKKNHLTKNKTAYCNRFNPFANVPMSSKTSSFSTPPAVPSNVLSKLAQPIVNLPVSSTCPSIAPIALSTPVGVSLAAQAATESTRSFVKTTPVIPKITVTDAVRTGVSSNAKETSELKPKLSSLLPWISDADDSPEQKLKTMKPQPKSPSLNKDILKVKTEPAEAVAAIAQQESPRASSSLSMSFFEDDKANGFPFLHSPRRSNEPLPVVEFSDDEENDIAHSTFSHATDHLLGNSNRGNQVNGAAPVTNLPWSTDP